MPHFVDRQKLDELESDLRHPINKLSQNRDVLDSQIVFAPQSKQWRENAGDLLVWRKIHCVHRLRRFSQISFGLPCFHLCKSAKSVG